MEISDKKKHWETIYRTKEINEVSWFQPTPETSLYFIKKFQIPSDAKIIDVGGGDSFFADHLLDLGFTGITVLDISETAIKKAKIRLGDKAVKVKWIEADSASFKPTEKYDFWHDRAAFHFLTEDNEIENYIETASQYINPNGILVLGTFSESGPKKCSGIEIRQYSEITLQKRFIKSFEKIECITVDHKTPFNTVQNFIFCSFRKRTSVLD